MRYSLKNFKDLWQKNKQISEAKKVKHELNPGLMLPWLKRSTELEKKTLKIEVTHKGSLILLRIIHFDKLYDLKYPKIAL